MRIEVGQPIVLGGVSYTLTEKLGSGAVSDVYRATLAGVPTDMVVKVVRQDTTPDEEGQRKIEGVRQEAQVLTTLNQAEDPMWDNIIGIANRVHRAQQTASQRLVVALFDSGEIAPDQPYLVQELTPPALERFDVETLADERRILSIAHAMTQAMALAHQHNLALKDFDPRTKLDRVRVRWLDEEDRFEFKLIDWNVTGGPEDVPQDLFYFGGHLYYLLLGRHLVLDVAGRPPANLGLGVPRWDWLTEGSREILQRLLHRDPVRRYRRAVELEADLAWWLDALHQADTPNAVDRLQDRIWQARPQERHDRVLAVADLAQRLDLSTEARRMFELWADQARQELEKETWLPIADARVSLLSGAYMAAVEKFSTQLRQLDERSEAARMARLLRLQAQAGHLLKQANQGADIRPTDEWASLTRAAQALLQRQWDAAQNALQEHTALLTWQPVVEQLALAEAGLLFNEAADASAQAEPRRADADRADWATVEAGHLEQLEKAINLLQQAVKKAPKEPDFKDRLQTEQAHLGLRRALLTRYRDAEQFREQAKPYLQRGQDAAGRHDYDAAAKAFEEAVQALDNALAEFRAILEADSGQYRARRLQEQVQRQRGEAQHHQDLARSRPDQAQTFDDLRRILKLADDPSPLAAGIRYQTGRAWPRLVTMEPDPGKAARLLREGLGHFGGLKEVAETLGAMLELAELGRRVQSQLEIVPGTDLPAWFALPESDLGVRLTRLDADLTKLTLFDRWPALQETARRWKNQLLEYLAAYLRPQRDQAHMAVSEWDFDKALNVAEHAWDLVPEGLRSDLPPDVWRDGIEHIIQGVKDREQAESKLATLVQALAAGKRSFIEAAESTQTISLPDGVPTDDLQAVITELKRGANWEQARERASDMDTYAKIIRERQIMAGETIGPLSGKWVGLSDPLEQLRKRLLGSIELASQDLVSDLQTEVKTLTDHPEQSSEKLLKLYWQARWLAKSERGDVSPIVDTLPGTVRSLDAKARSLFYTFITTAQRQALMRARSILGTVENLNAGLVAMPIVNDKPLVELPPLPQGIEYERLSTPLDSRALERFRQVVDEFVKLDSRGSSPSGTPPRPAVIVPPVDTPPAVVPVPSESVSGPPPEVISLEEVASPEPVARGTAWDSQVQSQ